MSIEEDVKRCKELIKIEHANWIGMSNQSAISNVLAEREQDKKRIKQLEKENGELRERVKELEEDLYSANKIVEEYIDSIPKQKIKDKFEKIQLLYENNLKKIDLKEVEKIDRKIFEGIRLEAQRDLARELLQESEDKMMQINFNGDIKDISRESRVINNDK